MAYAGLAREDRCCGVRFELCSSLVPCSFRHPHQISSWRQLLSDPQLEDREEAAILNLCVGRGLCGHLRGVIHTEAGGPSVRLVCLGPSVRGNSSKPGTWSSAGSTLHCFWTGGHVGIKHRWPFGNIIFSLLVFGSSLTFLDNSLVGILTPH